jgi:hypothetical protein
LLPAGEQVWAQVAPGNAASVRAALAAGFRPVGAEVLLHPMWTSAGLATDSFDWFVDLAENPANPADSDHDTPDQQEPEEQREAAEVGAPHEVSDDSY